MIEISVLQDNLLLNRPNKKWIHILICSFALGSLDLFKNSSDLNWWLENSISNGLLSEP